MAQAIDITLKFNVIPQIRFALPQAAEDYNTRYLTLIRSWAMQTAPRSKRNEPGYVHMVDTHLLDFSKPGMPVLTVGKFYAPHVHYGTYKMAARPWLQQAVDREADNYTHGAAQILDKILAAHGLH